MAPIRRNVPKQAAKSSGKPIGRKAASSVTAEKKTQPIERPAAPRQDETPVVIKNEEKENDVSRNSTSQIAPKVDLQMMGLFQSLMPPGANGGIYNSQGSQVAPVMVPVHPNDIKRMEAEQAIRDRANNNHILDPNDPIFAGYRKGDKFVIRRAFQWVENGVGREIKVGDPNVKYNNTCRHILKHSPPGTLELIERGPEIENPVPHVHEPVHGTAPTQQPQMAAMPITIPPELAGLFLQWLQQQSAGQQQQPLTQIVPTQQQVAQAPVAAPMPIQELDSVPKNLKAPGSLKPAAIQLTEEQMQDPEIMEYYVRTGQLLVK